MAAIVAGLVRIDLDALCGGVLDRPPEQRLIEVDAAEPLQPLRLTKELETLVGLAQDRGVERPATEVVDRHDRAGRHPLLARVVEGGRLGLRQQRDLADVGLSDGLLEQVELVRPVAGRMAQGDRRGRLPELLRDPCDDRAQEVGEQRLGSVRGAAEDDRGRVAQAPLELAARARRFGEGSPLRGFADEDLAVGTQEHDRRNRRGALAELEDLQSIAARDRGRGVRGPEVDPERVGHQSLRSLAGLPSLACGAPRGTTDETSRPSSRGARDTFSVTPDGTLAGRKEGHTPMPAGVMVAPATEQLDAVVGDVRSIARNLDRDDLADRLDDIRRRAARTDTVVCVVGEFKKGKSALINALLGSAVCPVDDDLATAAVTVVRYGETPSATSPPPRGWRVGRRADRTDRRARLGAGAGRS